MLGATLTAWMPKTLKSAFNDLSSRFRCGDELIAEESRHSLHQACGYITFAHGHRAFMASVGA
jgi:hypothetical protein